MWNIAFRRKPFVKNVIPNKFIPVGMGAASTSDSWFAAAYPTAWARDNSVGRYGVGASGPAAVGPSGSRTAG